LKERDRTVEIFRLKLDDPRMVKVSHEAKLVMKREEASSIKWPLAKLKGGAAPHTVAESFPNLSKAALPVVKSVG
jgi:hypothetical protein